jgi:hypothetical protein
MRAGWGHGEPHREVEASAQRGHEEEAPPRDRDRTGRIRGLHSRRVFEGRTVTPAASGGARYAAIRSGSQSARSARELGRATCSQVSTATNMPPAARRSSVRVTSTPASNRAPAIVPNKISNPAGSSSPVHGSQSCTVSGRRGLDLQPRSQPAIQWLWVSVRGQRAHGVACAPPLTSSRKGPARRMNETARSATTTMANPTSTARSP